MKDIPLIIILDRLRSAHNTGNIYRLADAVGARRIIACGYTPMPGHPKLQKTAMNADSFLHVEHAETSLEAVQRLHSEGLTHIFAAEPGPESACPWEMTWPRPCAIIFGNEALGIAPETIACCEGVIGLPMFGGKASINVGNAAAVILYGAMKYYQANGGLL